MPFKCVPAVIGFACLSAFLFRPVDLHGQDNEIGGIRIKPGLGVEYFSRTIVWDEGQSSSKLKASIAILRADIELQKGFLLGLFGGYNLSNFNGMIFRQLPFSIDYEAGNIGCLFWGAELDKNLFSLDPYEIGVQAQFVMSLGRQKELAVSGLNQTGSLSAKGRWQRAGIGPVIRYTGYEDFVPFLAVSYNKLWGTFSMAETVQALTGTEEKTISGGGSIGIAFGTTFNPSETFNLKVEITALPYKKTGGGLDVDYGASIKAVVLF